VSSGLIAKTILRLICCVAELGTIAVPAFAHDLNVNYMIASGSEPLYGYWLRPASAELAPVDAASADDHFFTHICGTQAMANVTVTPGKSGPIEVLVQLEDGDEKPLAADRVSVTLSNAAAGTAPITAEAEQVANDSWRVRMFAASSGKWFLSLSIVLGQNDYVEMTAPILIE
jgi:periplasmic copper chaperone A